MRLTRLGFARHNASVAFARVARRFVIGVTVLGVLGLAVLPPEHFHRAGTRDGHRSGITHRHYAPHPPVAGPASAARMNDHDDRPVWLDASLPAPTRAVALVCPTDAILNQESPAAPSPLKRLGAVEFASLRVHGPPLATPLGLRAPPASI